VKIQTPLKLLIFICAISSVSAASFDCKKANTKIEKTICASSELSKLDEQLAEAYQQAIKVCNDTSGTIKAKQFDWLKSSIAEFKGCLKPQECIKELYPERIKHLNNILNQCQLLSTGNTQKIEKFVITNASKHYDFILHLQADCKSSSTCESPFAVVQIFKKGTTALLQKIPMESIFVTIEKENVLVNSAKLYDYQGTVNVGDFNFDGQEDFAVQNGNNGSYGGPSYDVFLAAKGQFRYSSELSKLIESSLGFFGVDSKRKRLTTFSKSGCCYHETVEYQIVKNQPVPVVRFIDDALSSGNDGLGYVIEEHFVHGKWKLKHKKSYRLEEIKNTD
jgi:uncharacterized protein